jgi:hypothetical protein
MITCPACGHQNDNNAFRCTSCHTVIQQPPAAPYGPPQGLPNYPVPHAPVPNYLAQAIIVTLICCMPAGIPAIVFAAQSMSKEGSGDIAGALDSAQKAKTWCWVSFGVGAVVIVGYFIFFLLAMAGGTMTFEG